VDGEIQRENVVIIVVDESGQDRARFEIVEAWPCKYAIMDLKAKGNGVSIETLELCNEGITRIA
jgi:phage tail-like protein